MLQWMGGARHKMKATKGSLLKRQREFFDRRKEKLRNKRRSESSKLLTLADYIRQNLHGGESLDILGLRSLNPTPADVNSPANSDANLPNVATASSKPKSENAGGASSNVSASSVGGLEGDDQDTSSPQRERKIKSRRITQEQKQETEAQTQRIPGVSHAVKQEKKELVSLTSELPLPGKRRNPVHVGNLQTKKVAPAPQLILMDAITSDVKGGSRGKKRSPAEVYADFSQDEIDGAIDGKISDHHQQQLIASHRNVSDWGDMKQPTPLSMRLKVPGTQDSSDLLSRFLSTQKLKSIKEINSHQHGRKRQGLNKSEKDSLLETEYLLNSFRITHNETNDVGFSNATFNTTTRMVKEEPLLIDLPTARLDLERFHVKPEPEEFDTSDPFVTIASHQEQGSSFPFLITNNHQVKRENHEYDFLSPKFNTGGHQVTQRFPLLTDFSYNGDTFDVGRDIFERQEGSSSPGSNDPVNWDSDPPPHTSSTPAYFRETAAMKLDKLWLPLEGSQDEEQQAVAAYSSLDDFSPKRMKTMRSNFELEASDWDEPLQRKNICTYTDEWNWDTPRRQEYNNPVWSGGNFGQMSNHDDDKSWSQTVTGGPEYFTDYRTGDRDFLHSTSPGQYDAMQGKDLTSETQAIIAPSEFLQDSKLTFLPQINNGKEDFIIVCFSDSKDSLDVDADTIHRPIQSINYPQLQLLRNVESPSKTDHDIHVLSPETPPNRNSPDVDDSRVLLNVCTTEKTTTTTPNRLTFGREDSPCGTNLTGAHQSQKEYLPLLNSVSSLKRSTGFQSWQADEPRSEAYPEPQSPKARRPSSKLLSLDGEKFEDDLEHHCSNSEKADQCFSSNVLYNHGDDHATVQHENIMHNDVEENSLDACYSTPLKEVLREDMNGMSTTKGKIMPQERLESGNAHDYGCQASFSSQEECSPAFQQNTVQVVLSKLERPALSCGSKQGTFPEHAPIKNVDSVLIKLQRPTHPCSHGPGHQATLSEKGAQPKDIEPKGDINQKRHLELEIEPTAECEQRSLKHLKFSGSRESQPLSNADGSCVGLPASNPVIRSSNEDAQKRGSSDFTNQRTKEARMSLDDIDAIASSCQPSRRGNESNTYSSRSGVEIKNLSTSSVPAGDSIQRDPSNVSRKSQLPPTPEEGKPSTRIPDPPPEGDGADCTRGSRKNPILIVPDKEQFCLAEFKPPASHAGGLEIGSNTPQVAARQEIVGLGSQDQQGLNDSQYYQRRLENFQQGGGSTTNYDAAYVKMLESYVVQLRLENRVLRLLSNGS